MSALLEALYLPGRTMYVVIHAGGQVWNKDTAAFENYNQGNWSHYAVALSEQTSSGYYSASYPSAIASGTLSTDCLYQQNGATPTLPGLPGGDSFINAFQSQGTNLQTIAGSGQAAINLEDSTLSILPGAVASGTPTTTQAITTLTLGQDNALNGRVILWTSGAAQYQASIITAYNHLTSLLTFSPPLTTAPSVADTFTIV